ncbi:MAG: hypothetical protein WAM14_07480 [Candidatus Nitrosopolaris sp.]
MIIIKRRLVMTHPVIVTITSITIAHRVVPVVVVVVPGHLTMGAQASNSLDFTPALV